MAVGSAAVHVVAVGGHLRLVAGFDQAAIIGHPHTSFVRDPDRLRELRPTAGPSGWRALWRQVGEVLVAAAVGTEARSDPRGFGGAARRALQRLAELEED